MSVKPSIVAVAAAAAALCACGATPDRAAVQSWQDEVAKTIPRCRSQIECDVKWSAARQYVVTNSVWKIQHLTPDFIQTYPSPSGLEQIAWTVDKKPQQDGSFTIEAGVSCGAPYSCTPHVLLALRDFQRFVNAAWKAAPAAPAAMVSPPAAPAAIVQTESTAAKPAKSTEPPLKDAFAAERFSRNARCADISATFVGRGPGYETYSFRCTNGDTLVVQCEMGNCRALK